MRIDITEQSLNDELERLTRENECQRQDIDHLQYTNKLLEEQIHLSSIVQNNEATDQMRTKENGEKNDQTKGMKLLKKKIGS